MYLDIVLQEIKPKNTLAVVILRSCNEWEIPNLSLSKGTVISQDPFGQILFTISNRIRFQAVLLIVIVSQCCLFPVMLF